MKQLRVLQVNKLYYPVVGGVERVAQQLAEGLQERLEIKTLVCQKKGRGAVEVINGASVERASSMGMAFSMPISFSFLSRFRRLSKASDIIQLHMPFPLADMALFLSGYRGKLVLWWHSDIVKQKRLLKLYRPLLLWTLRRADLIIAATQGHIDHSDYLPAFRDKCTVIPFGVKMALLERDLLLQKPVQPAADCIALFAGRLVYYKGCDILLEAFQKIQGAELWVAGDGPLRQDLEEQAQRLGIAQSVRFLGSLPEDKLGEAFAQCDFFVLPSVAKSEAFGLVQIEAMAYGKPVINTDLPSGVPYVSLDDVTGLTVPPGDAAALAEAMQKLVDKPGLRQRYGKAAYERARKEFSQDKMIERVYTAYKSLFE